MYYLPILAEAKNWRQIWLDSEKFRSRHRAKKARLRSRNTYHRQQRQMYGQDVTGNCGGFFALPFSTRHRSYVSTVIALVLISYFLFFIQLTVVGNSRHIFASSLDTKSLIRILNTTSRVIFLLLRQRRGS